MSDQLVAYSKFEFIDPKASSQMASQDERFDSSLRDNIRCDYSLKIDL